MRVINLSYRFVQNREAAEDIAQDVFIKIYEKRLKFDPKAKFTTWLYRVTVNASIDFLRRTKKGISFEKTTFSDDSGDSRTQRDFKDPKAVSPLAVIEDKELRNAVQKAIGELPEKYRQVILLYRFEDLPYREIAQILGITEKAVERRLYQAKEHLRNSLKGCL